MKNVIKRGIIILSIISMVGVGATKVKAMNIKNNTITITMGSEDPDGER